MSDSHQYKSGRQVHEKRVIEAMARHEDKLLARIMRSCIAKKTGIAERVPPLESKRFRAITCDSSINLTHTSNPTPPNFAGQYVDSIHSYILSSHLLFHLPISFKLLGVQLGGKSSSLVPHILSPIPTTISNTPPFIKNSCVIQFLVHGFPFSAARWMYFAW